MPTGQQYATNVPQTTLTAGILAGSTSFGVSSLSGWPATPFTAVLDIGTSTQEPIDVLAVAGNTVTSCTRSIDGTTAFAHNINATFTHSDIGRDFREARAHIDASSGVHGVTGSVVGTTDAQTLTAKNWSTTGAVVGTRLVGGNSSGAPVAGTFLLGDFVVNTNGTVYVCTTAGTPGTWTQVGTATAVADAQLSNLLGWTFDISACVNTGIVVSSGDVHLMKMSLPSTTTVTSIVCILPAAGSGLTSGRNFAGIYNLSGTLLGQTADQTSAWGSAGSQVMAISGGPIVVPAGVYYLAFLSNGTTPPTLQGATGLSGNARYGLTSITPYRHSLGGSGQISLPGTIASIGNTNFDTSMIWMGVR